MEQFQDFYASSQQDGVDPLMKIFGSGRLSSSSGSQDVSGTMDKDIHSGSQDVSDTMDKDIQPIGAGSQDLFSSQSSSQIQQQIDLTLQLTEYVWVQCDNPECQKWRRIPATHVDNLDDDPWYCHMNPDGATNRCTVAEEDHAQYDRMAKKAGIKFVMSMLNVGALVWAKMAGYCRWPGLVTRDPDTGVHVHIDIDGDPHSYHIEFLGKPHTHSWVVARAVEMFGHRDVHEVMDIPHLEPSTRGRRRCGRGRGMTESSQSKQRKSFKRVKIEDIINKEANFLLTLSSEERMKYCVFKYDHNRWLMETAKMKRMSDKKLKEEKSCHHCSNKPKKAKLNHSQSSSAMSPHSRDRSKNGVVTPDDYIDSARTKQSAMAGVKNTKRGRKKREHATTTGHDSGLGMSYDDLVSGNATGTVQTEGTVSVFESPSQFSQSKLKFTNTMVDKTKEEKFTIDIDMYRRNEAAFEHDVRRFLSRNGQTIKCTPLWHNVPVRLFQLYLTVHERGGFKMVTQKKQWTSVYKELTEQQQTTSGAVAKLYYEKNLYPYELYISGEDYKSALKHKRVPTSNPKPTPGPKSRKPVKGLTSVDKTKDMTKLHTQPTTETKQDLEFSQEDTGSYCQDIEAILGVLEDEYDSIMSSPTGPEKTKAKPSVSIKYHDDTTESSSNVQGQITSEFHDIIPSDNTAQKVPDVDGTFTNIEGDIYDVDDKILHEMRALEDEMREIDGEHGDTL